MIDLLINIVLFSLLACSADKKRKELIPTYDRYSNGWTYNNPSTVWSDFDNSSSYWLYRFVILIFLNTEFFRVLYSHLHDIVGEEKYSPEAFSITKDWPVFSMEIYSFSHGSASVISLNLFIVSWHLKHLGFTNNLEWNICVHREPLLGMKTFWPSFFSICIPLGHPLPLYWRCFTSCSETPLLFKRYLVASNVCWDEHVRPIIWV